MINGQSLAGVTHKEAVDVLRNAPPLVQIIVASKVFHVLYISFYLKCFFLKQKEVDCLKIIYCIHRFTWFLFILL